MSELFGVLFEMDQVPTTQATDAERWAAVSAVPQQREDRLPLEEAQGMWNRIYELFGASSESAMDEAFSAVNMYFLVNGASPSGKYARLVRTAGGTLVSVDSIVKITGRLEGQIRQFLRANMRKSYFCLKYSSAVKHDFALQDKAERLGIPRDMAWLLADWLRDCEYLTGEEAQLHTGLSSKLIENANIRRRSPALSHRADEMPPSQNEFPVPSVSAAPSGFAGATY